MRGATLRGARSLRAVARRATAAIAAAAGLAAAVFAASTAPAEPAQVRTAADLVGARDWDTYFPFRLGDSWTYDWMTEGPLAPGGVAARTRTFDGTSFIGDRVGYKLVADDGAYHLYTYEKGILAIHSSSDARRLLYYEPPVIVAAPDFTVGESRSVQQADGSRRFTTTFVGVEDVTVPLGTFSKVIVMRLRMEGSDYSSEATHYFAPRVGMIAYRYAVSEARTGAGLLSVDARLRIARLAGEVVSSAADLARVPAAESPAVGEDRAVRDLLRDALDRRYTWGPTFPGLTGTAELRETGKPDLRGRFVIAPDLSVRIEADSDAARSALRNEISSFITQRKELAFDLVYAETTFTRTETRPDGTVVITATGDPLATTYAVRGGEIVEVGRSVGRLSYVARDRSKLKTEDGRTITVEYDVVYLSNEDRSERSLERTRDAYSRLGEHWVPTGRRVERTSAGQPAVTRELTLSGLGRP